jgi:hypothetical protein
MVALAASSTWAAAQSTDQRGTVRPPAELQFEIDGQRIEVRVDGKDVRVDIDDESDPSSRIKVDGSTCRVFDAHGSPICRVTWDPVSVRLDFSELSNHAYLGVDLQPVPPALCEHLGLDGAKAAYVVAVSPRSPAEKAGVAVHDIVLRVDGEPMSSDEFRAHLAGRKPGEVARLSVLRRGEEEQIEVTLGRAAWQDPAASGLLSRLMLVPEVLSRTELSGRLLGSDGLAYVFPELTNQAQVPAGAAPAKELREQIDRVERRLDEIEKLIRSVRDKREN